MKAMILDMCILSHKPQTVVFDVRTRGGQRRGQERGFARNITLPPPGSKRQTWRPRFLFSRAVPANAPGQNRELELKKNTSFLPTAISPWPELFPFFL